MTNTTLTIDQALQQAVNYHQAGQLPEAEQLYRAILQVQPTHADANHNLGLLAVAVGKTTEALPFFKLALETNPNQAQFWLSYIDGLIKTQQFELARSVLAQGQKIGLKGNKTNELVALLPPPQNSDIYATAVNLREAGGYLEAIDWLNSWLEKNPHDANAYAHLAHVFYLKKQDAPAWAALNQALAINPSSALVQRNHARLLLKQQKITDALKIAQSLYEANSQEPENKVVFAATLVVNQQDEQAKILCESALQQRPQYAEALAILGQLHLKAGDKVAALSFLEQALKIKPHLVQLYLVTANLYNENKNLPAAIATLQKVLTYEPNEVGYQMALGEFLRLNHQTEEAIALLQKTVQLAPDNADAWVNLGTALQQNGELQNAKEAYDKALAINPAQGEIFSNLGVMAKDEGNWELALEYFDKALILLPTRLPIMVNKAATLNHLGRDEEAEKMAHAALKIDSLCENAHTILGGIFQNRNCLHKANAHYLKALELEADNEEAALALTVNHYLLLDYSQAIHYLKQALPILNKPALKKFKSSKTYATYMVFLLNWWENEIKQGLDFNAKNTELPFLAVVGESHSLAVHRTDFALQEMPYRCQAHWIGGIKMWHLAQAKSHPMKQRVRQVLSDLPANSPILFTIGEIDCRLDEGIWSTAKKQAADYQTLIEKTVTGYLDWLEETLKKTSQQQIIIQGIPAPNYHKELEMSDENVPEFLAMINEVNQQLKYYTLQKGWQFLDVYAATVAENGKSHGQWHLDSHHLKPAFYRQAQNWLSH